MSTSTGSYNFDRLRIILSEFSGDAVANCGGDYPEEYLEQANELQTCGFRLRSAVVVAELVRSFDYLSRLGAVLQELSRLGEAVFSVTARWPTVGSSASESQRPGYEYHQAVLRVPEIALAVCEKIKLLADSDTDSDTVREYSNQGGDLTDEAAQKRAERILSSSQRKLVARFLVPNDDSPAADSVVHFLDSIAFLAAKGQDGVGIAAILDGYAGQGSRPDKFTECFMKITTKFSGISKSFEDGTKLFRTRVLQAMPYLHEFDRSSTLDSAIGQISAAMTGPKGSIKWNARDLTLEEIRYNL